MKKSKWQYIVAILLFMCIVGIAIIGFFTGFLDKKESLYQEKKKAEEIQLRKEPEIRIKIKEKVRPKQPLHKEQKQRLTRGRMAAVPSGILITGKMTLYDLEDITGIPARKIADELGIPSNAYINEHLGRLRKRYLFSMQKVRDIVASLMKKKERNNKRKN
jgi:hypothetical protein